MKKALFAIVYDFDGTLACGNMQERNFIPAIGMTSSSFWEEVKRKSQESKADEILIYMKLMLDKAKTSEVQVHIDKFKSYGKDLPFFKGLLPFKNENFIEDGWFKRINTYGLESGIKIEHYIVSSGIREMVEGSPIAGEFKAIFASSFYYDHNSVACWPALALNYTTKTQYIFRINKGCLDVNDHLEINRFLPDPVRRIPFKHMIYIGDGETDVPCFRLVKDLNGHSIAVYKPNTPNAKKKLMRFFKEGRVNFIAPADYRDGTNIDKIVKAIIDKTACDLSLNKFSPRP